MTVFMSKESELINKLYFHNLCSLLKSPIQIKDPGLFLDIFSSFSICSAKILAIFIFALALVYLPIDPLVPIVQHS